MTKITVHKKNKLNLDKGSAQNYICEMVNQLREIADLAGLDHEATLLQATSIAISIKKEASKY